jgi:hypothetical protein
MDNLIEKYGCFENIPEYLLDEDICISYLKKFYFTSWYMDSRSFESREIKNRAVLSHIPERIQTYKFFYKIISEKNILFEHIPKKYLDKEMYKHALQNIKISFEEIPKEYLDREIYLYFMESIYDFNQVPEEYLDYDFYLNSVIKNPLLLKKISFSLQNNKTFLKDVFKKSIFLVTYFDKKYQNYNKCSKCVNYRFFSITKIPKKYINYPFIKKNIFEYENKNKEDLNHAFLNKFIDIFMSLKINLNKSNYSYYYF